MTAGFIETLFRVPGPILAVDIVVKATLILTTVGAVTLPCGAPRPRRGTSRGASAWEPRALTPLSLSVPAWSVQALPTAAEPVSTTGSAPGPELSHELRADTGPQLKDEVVLDDDGASSEPFPYVRI